MPGIAVKVPFKDHYIGQFAIQDLKMNSLPTNRGNNSVGWFTTSEVQLVTWWISDGKMGHVEWYKGEEIATVVRMILQGLDKVIQIVQNSILDVLKQDGLRIVNIMWVAF